MHSIICIKPVPAPAKISARFLSNGIVPRGVPTNLHELVAAEIAASSVTRRSARPACSLRGCIHLSSDCGRRVPWVPKLRCCLSNAPLSMTRSYPRRTHPRPRSRRSASYLVGALSSLFASRPSTTWPRSAPGSQSSPVYCGSTTLPEPSTSISASRASDAEQRDCRPRRRRPWV